MFSAQDTKDTTSRNFLHKAMIQLNPAKQTLGQSLLKGILLMGKMRMMGMAIKTPRSNKLILDATISSYRDTDQWLDTLIRRNIKECSTILEKFGKLLMDVYNQSKDYAQDRGLLDPFPLEPITDHEDEIEEWITEHRERIAKAKEMEAKLLNAFLIAQDDLTSVRDHTGRHRAASWMARVALIETPPPEAAILRGDTEVYLKRLSKPQHGR